MIVFLYGSDTYRLSKYKNELIGRYRNKYSSGVNFLEIDFSENSDVERMKSAIRTVSFFNEHRLLVCKNVFINKQRADEALEYIKDYELFLSRDTTLVITQDSSEKEIAAKHKKLAEELLTKSTTVKSFEPLIGAKLVQWVEDEVRGRGCQMGRGVAEKLINVAGNESCELINEIDKLADYRGDGEIKNSDIDLLVAPKIDMDIFQLTDAIANGNNNKFIQTVYKELKTGRDPYYILTMIAFQLRNMVVIKDMLNRGFSNQEVAVKAGIHPFVIKKIVAGVADVNMDRLKFLYARMLHIEVSSKEGHANITDSLFSFMNS